MNYKQKYLKYKLKYLNLKKKMSGGSFEISENDCEFVQQQIDAAEEYNKLDDYDLATKIMNENSGNIKDIEEELAKYRKTIPQLVRIGGIEEELGANLLRKVTSVEKILIIDPLRKDIEKKEKKQEEAEEEYRKQKREFGEQFGINFEETIRSVEHLLPIHRAARTIQSILIGKQDRRKVAETKNKSAITIKSILTGKQDRRKVAEEKKRAIEGPLLSAFRQREKAEYDKKKTTDKSDKSEDSDNSYWSD